MNYSMLKSLFLAAKTGDAQKIFEIHTQHSGEKKFLDHLDEYDRSPLFYAASRGKISCVEALLSLGADPLAHSNKIFFLSKFSVRETPVIGATLKQQTECLNKLLDAVEERQRNGVTIQDYLISEALVEAIRRKKPKSLKIILDRGIDPNTMLDGMTALSTAVLTESYRCMSLLLKKGASVDLTNTKPDFAYCSPLAIAAFDGNKKAATLLFNHGADPMSRDNMGHVPLHHAVKNSAETCIDMIKVLLNQGTDINILNGYGETPLILASQLGNSNAIGILLAQGGDPNIPNKQGKTALMYAAEKPIKTENVKTLLAYGADPELTDADGKSALDMAHSIHADRLTAEIQRRRLQGITEEQDELENDNAGLVL